MPTFAIVVILFFGGVGTSFIAENSIPGNILYPVKTFVNDGAMSFAAVGDKAEAKLQARLVDRRLSEAEEMQEKGILNKKRSEEVLTKTERYDKIFTEKTESMIENKKFSEATEAQSEYEVILVSHEKKLSGLIFSEKEDPLIKKIYEQTKDQYMRLTEERKTVETKTFSGLGGNAREAALGAKENARKKIDEALWHLASQKNSVSKEKYVRAEESLKAAEGAFAEGSAKIEANAYRDAFALFKKAERETVSMKLILSEKDAVSAPVKVSPPPAENPAVSEPLACRRSGCSGQICADAAMADGLVTTCEWRPEYDCYQMAACERQEDGRCGWTQGEEMKACIEKAHLAVPLETVR